MAVTRNVYLQAYKNPSSTERICHNMWNEGDWSMLIISETNFIARKKSPTQLRAGLLQCLLVVLF